LLESNIQSDKDENIGKIYIIIQKIVTYFMYVINSFSRCFDGFG
jgi:hypothetical protein